MSNSGVELTPDTVNVFAFFSLSGAIELGMLRSGIDALFPATNLF